MARSDATVVGTWPVRSRSVGSCVYEVLIRDDGFISCDCADWINRRAAVPEHTVDAPAYPIFDKRKGREVMVEPHCKHIRENVLPIIRRRGVPRSAAEMAAAIDEADGRMANIEV